MNYFVFGGKSSRYFGIYLKAPFVISEAVPSYEELVVPGRNGTLLIENHSFLNRSAEAECFVLRRDADKALSEISQWLMRAGGYQRLELPDYPDSFFLARCISAPRITSNRNGYVEFQLKFTCKPQRFLKTGERAIVVDDTDTVYNRHFDSKPLLTIHGTGICAVGIGSTQIRITDLEDYITIDCETHNCYRQMENLNPFVTVPEFPSLVNGENEIYIDGGTTKLEIVPRWWTL